MVGIGVKIPRSSVVRGAIMSDPKTADEVSISIYPTDIYSRQFSVSSAGVFVVLHPWTRAGVSRPARGQLPLSSGRELQAPDLPASRPIRFENNPGPVA